MKCPRCNQDVSTNPHNVIMKNTCNNLECSFYRREINFVNPDDINDNFWGKTYLICITRFGMPYVINSDNEQDAIDEMIDYIEANKWEGLLLDQNDDDDNEMIESGNYICGGNHGRYLSTYNVRIESL